MAVVCLQYQDLVDGKDLTSEVSKAFGPEGLGFLAVIGVPGLEEKRKACLDQIYQLSRLPKETLDGYAVPPFYQRGWSCGQEKMKDGTPDNHKGSFYFAPLADSFEGVSAELVEKYPTMYGTNVFPTELPDFESKVKDCSKLMIEVGKLLAKQCDAILKAANITNFNHLESIINDSKHHIGRALHYFAASRQEDSSMDDWCGWHNDHGSLTSLVPAMYHNDTSGEAIPNPDPEAGLYIKTRQGEIVHAKPPAGAMLFQIGETAQIHSGGLLKATPHMVRSVNMPNISRTTMAVFMEPATEFPMNMPPNTDVDAALRCEHMPEGVPALGTRWQKEDCFGEFGSKTVAAYYN